MLRILLSCLILSLFVQQTAAQQSPLESYIAEGTESNLALRQKGLSIEKSRQALREARGLFMPQLSFMASYTLAGGGRALEFPVGDLLNPVYATLNQLTGSEQFPTNIENVNEQFAPNNFQETKFRLVQPLFNSDIYFNYQAKKQLIGVEEATLKVYQQELIRDIRTAYYGWLKTVSVLEIYQQTEVLLREILRVNQSLVKNDKATLDAIYRAEYELSKLQMERAQILRQNQSAQAYLNFLLNRPLDLELEADSSLRPEILSRELAELVSISIENRQEIRQLQLAQLANLQSVNMNKTHLLPELNAMLDIGYQGFGYKFTDQEYWLAGLSLQWDLFQGFQNQARLQQAEIQQQMLQLQQEEVSRQIQLQVREAWFDLKASRAAMQAAEDGLRSARQNFRLVEKKYRQNQASLLELLDARTQFTQSQLQLSIDTYDWLIRDANMAFALGR